MKKAIHQIKKIFKTTLSPIVILIILGCGVYVPLWITSAYISSSQTGYTVESIPVLGSDSSEYALLADNLHKNGCFSLNNCELFETFRTPGYPFFVFFIKSLFNSLFAVTFVQCLLALLTGYLIYKILLNYTNHRWASYGMILFVLEPSVILHSLLILSDIPFIFLLMLSFFLVIKSDQKLVFALCSGLLLGISVLFRPISLFLLPVFIFIYIYFDNLRGRYLAKMILILTLSFIVPLIPWFYRNYTHTKVWGLSSVSSYNIAYYNIPFFISYKENKSVIEAQKEIEELSGLKINEWLNLENSKKISVVSFDYLKGDLFGYGFFHMVKTIQFFFGSSVKNLVYSYNLLYDNDLNYGYESGSVFDSFIKGEIKEVAKRLTSEWVFLAERVFWLIILIGGIIPLFKKETRKLAAICWIVILYFAILTGPVSYVRYRLPTEPFLFILFVSGSCILKDFIKRIR